MHVWEYLKLINCLISSTLLLNC